MAARQAATNASANLVQHSAEARPFTAWLCLAMLLADIAFMVWARDRGLDRRDDAFYLLAAANPNFVSASDFAHVWRPLFLLTGGSLAGMRLGQMSLLVACGAGLGWQVGGFLRIADPRLRAAITFAVGSCVFWQCDLWQTTAGYNGLNLIGLMLFFTGLFAASTAREGAPSVVDLAPAIGLAALGLVAMALAKPPTAAIALLLGLAWIALIRPRRAFVCVLGVGLIAATLFALSTVAFHGGPVGYLQNLQ